MPRKETVSNPGAFYLVAFAGTNFANVDGNGNFNNNVASNVGGGAAPDSVRAAKCRIIYPIAPTPKEKASVR
jgi:hypothetical protein